MYRASQLNLALLVMAAGPLVGASPFCYCEKNRNRGGTRIEMEPGGPEPLPPEISGYYAASIEAERLGKGHGQIEQERTLELLERYLPPPPAVILDVGGGPGAYACWLAARGYTVHLVDALPLHVEQAREASASQPGAALASATVGDARSLDAPEESADGVLLLGPLYHLTEREDRLAALSQARRVLKPCGILLAAAISRFASLLSGLSNDMFKEPEAARIVERDLRDGQHRNPTPILEYFTTAFFHLPGELAAEVTEAGLSVETLLGLEGPGWLLSDFPRRWDDPSQRERMLAAARAVEREPSLLGMSAHLVAVARRP